MLPVTICNDIRLLLVASLATIERTHAKHTRSHFMPV
jgi:hypothetical protein